MNKPVDEIRQMYINNPPEGMTANQVKNMSELFNNCHLLKQIFQNFSCCWKQNKKAKLSSVKTTSQLQN